MDDSSTLDADLEIPPPPLDDLPAVARALLVGYDEA